MIPGTLPPKQGLYDPINEHDACGVGFIADIKGRKSHDVVAQGIQILARIAHRGALGADPLVGDGAGILIQTPDAFFREETKKIGFDLPENGKYGVGMLFLPQDDETRAACEKIFLEFIEQEGQKFLGWRDVPTINEGLGKSVIACEPVIRQLFIEQGENCKDQDAFERKLYLIRKQAANKISNLDARGKETFYVPSMSSSTVNYKGMLLSDQVDKYYPDLLDERMVSAIALVHQRFSTNTFPKWELAHPFRMIAHNGEINTVRGNVNWMRARLRSMSSKLFGDDLEKIWPLINEGQSDSACFDNALELLTMSGYSMGHAMMMLIPESWDGNNLMDDDRRAFYEYHAALMEPWDGPAAVAFTDGKQIGATLDRNGLRPARYIITDDDKIIMASEMGVLDIPEEKIVKKWRLQPGKMFLADLEQGRIIDDEELKESLCTSRPYQDWLDQTQIKLSQLPSCPAPMIPDEDTLLNRQQAFGYTQEDLKVILTPMVNTGMEATGAMGADNPPAVLSNKARPLFNYFKQNFAQVTNPPIDPIREEVVMSLISLIGPRPNILDPDGAGSLMRLEVNQPLLTNTDIERIRQIEDHSAGAFKTCTLSICYPADQGSAGMDHALHELLKNAKRAVENGNNILILSDRDVDTDNMPIPALLATSAVHHHLIRSGLRTEAGLVIETGAAKEVHDYAMLAGYGAEAINPYLALDTLQTMNNEGYFSTDLSLEDVHQRYVKAIGKGLLKVMSKMGISTYQSYCGAQIFDAVGLSSSFVEKFFTGTATTIEGVGLQEVAEESVRWHKDAYGNNPIYKDILDVGGDYAYRERGEDHAWTPEVVTTLQKATRQNDSGSYKEYAKLVNEQNKVLTNFRGLFDFNYADISIPLEEVESIESIVKRFSTGPMSFGALSYEAHSTLAIAMNRLGGQSNTGEGGEMAERYKPLENGDSTRSAVKQVASGRFGVTNEYLVNADDIQIKMAQGAKPGEGGQLPGHKVDKTIGRVRHSTPGVALISPPPHHDIYSIEDLAQLIHDLKNVNPKSRISVKLVSEVGVGTVAAGVSKAHADHITISGQDGGTAATPLTSMKHAGSYWEIGLAETHQTLVLNHLRGRVCVQVDGGMKTGRDVAVAALLGADEYSFSTAPLVVEGCVMMRKCNQNTCPVGVATQNPELRKRFTGKPEHVINYFIMVANELREIMAKLGFRTVNEMIGRSDKLNKRKAIDHWKARGLDFTKIFYRPEVDDSVALYNCEEQDHGLEKALDNKLIELAQPALEKKEKVEIEMPICNENRTVGTMLSGEVAMRYGYAGLPTDTVKIKMSGTAGQSFGAFLANGVTLELAGEANDYVGKGLSGGKIIVYPQASSKIVPEENIIVGNTLLYGATSGECYFRGVAGERFAVRNSGAKAVVEGVGDHCCEYMTGGIVVVLGSVGRNFAAGMSGGIAYVLDDKGDFEKHCNLAQVELEKVEEIEESEHIDPYEDLLQYDALRLKDLIRNHYENTQSSVAKKILDDWATYRAKFVKVMPTDYKKALTQMQKEAETEKGGQ